MDMIALLLGLLGLSLAILQGCGNIADAIRETNKGEGVENDN